MKAAHLFLPHSFHHSKAHMLRHYSFFSYAAFFLIIGLALLFIKTDQPGILGFASNITVTDVVQSTNAERQKKGVPTLRLNAELSKAAEEKARDMFAKNYWAHFGPNGEKPWDFIKKHGYTYTAAGENLARDFQESNAVVTAWMNSPSHRENLLNKNYQDIGIAVVNGTLLGHETTLVVQMFGKPYRTKAELLDTGLAQADPTSPNPTAAQIAQAKPSQGPVSTPMPTTAPTDIPESVTTAGVNTLPAGPSQGRMAFLSQINPFTTVKALSIFFMGFILAFLILDTIIIRKRGVVRLATHSFAHVSVLAVIMISILLLGSGKIL